MVEKRRKYRTQEQPFCIQIELTEGCNLRCAFCGLQGIRAEGEKNFKFMEPETLRRLLRGVADAGWTPRLEFAMHGEPTMHPDYVGMIAQTRALAPRLQIMMTSNGGGILRKPGPVANIRALFDAGLNILALDNYKGVGIVPKIADAWLHPDVDHEDIEFYQYPAEPEGNPHQRHSRKTKFISVVADIEEARKGTHATLTNHAGCGLPPLEEPLMKQCAKPFREIGIRWDGSMAGCCNMWRGEYKVGNVNDTPIEELWQGNSMGALREMMFAGRRDLVKPCDVCDYTTYRNGLLPDNSGKAKMHKPDEQTAADVKAALRGRPLTEPRLREWETK